MRASQFFINTLKEAPADAEVVSQRLMLRAGLVRRLAAGIYTWMPLGLRVLRKVEAIVRAEMNRAGAIELFMPAVQPAELWQESGRWEHYGPELLRIRDRQQRDFVIGPTHEEVITDLARRELKSYRQLPKNFYQIQTKFRDEIRPRFGVMRGREFCMKDAYSFHADVADLEREYANMHATYTRIFTRLGLRFRSVAADTGSIGGSGSHEFHVLADSGEDALAYCPDSDYAANVELAPVVSAPTPRPPPCRPMQLCATPGIGSCEEVAHHFKVEPHQILKTLAVVAEEQLVLLLLRSDHVLNTIKLSKLEGMHGARFASAEEIQHQLGSPPGAIGPVGLQDNKIRIIADPAVLSMADFICGANQAGHHWEGVNWQRDLPLPATVADIRNVVAGDIAPDGKGTLQICRGIEVGHVFQLHTKYSAALQCSFLNEQGRTQIMEMGCYGIGITRIVAAAIEQGHDAQGIVFPLAIAPFSLVIIPLGGNKSEAVRTQAAAIYSAALELGIDVVLDDRNERPGVMLADWELVGVFARIVVGERGLQQGCVEYQERTAPQPLKLPLAELPQLLQQKLCAQK